MRKVWWSLGFCMACTASASEVPTQPAAEAPSAKVRRVQGEKASTLATLDAPARVLAAPDGLAVIGAPLGLRILRVRVRPGQTVKQGEPLMDVSSPELVRAAGALVAAELRMRGLDERRARLLPLVEQGLSRAVELNELDAARVTARAERETARAILRSAGLTDGAATALVEGDGTFALRSPIAGMVTSVDAVAGAFVDERAPALVEVTGAGAPQVEARFAVTPPAGAHFAWIGRSERVDLTLVALAPGVRKEDGARLGWLVPSDTKATLAPGALGRVRLEAADAWVAVPSRALHRGDVTSVETREGQKVVEVMIDTGSTAVVTGVAAGSFVRARASDETP